MTEYLCTARCQGAGHRSKEGEVVKVVPRERLLELLTPGQMYTETECSHCGALAVPLADETPTPKKIEVDYAELAAQADMCADLKNRLTIRPLSHNYRTMLNRLELLLRTVIEQRCFKERPEEP